MFLTLSQNFLEKFAGGLDGLLPAGLDLGIFEVGAAATERQMDKREDQYERAKPREIDF